MKPDTLTLRTLAQLDREIACVQAAADASRLADALESRRIAERMARYRAAADNFILAAAASIQPGILPG